MTGMALRREIAARLRPIAGEDAFLEAGFMLKHFDEHPESDLEQMVLRRQGGEPLGYVLGEWSFMGLTFLVDRSVLIPRPDTEIVCEAALSRLKIGQSVLDLCCGSGCIGITLAKRGGVRVCAADISADALRLARKNAERNIVTVQTVQSDLFDRVEGVFDMIVCNPPYLDRSEMQLRDASLRFEPELALDGGEDGLDFYRRIRADCTRFIKPGGFLILEIGYRQEQAVCALFDGAMCIRDYGDRPRCVIVRNI